jgi:hypothetical protein
MGLGLLYLISKGNEDLYLNYQPQITFFKTIYKRHTNFSSETIDQFFKTTPDFGRKVSVTISKNADLLGEIYLSIELPAINEYINSSNIRKTFRWVNNIGYALINNVDIYIGGILIDRHLGEWLHIYNELNLEKGHRRGYDIITGNIKSLNEFSEIKDSYIINIPLKFWFCLDSGLYLPLTSLTNHDVVIEIEFNDFNKCYIESPSHYVKINEQYVLFNENEIIEQNANGNIIIARFKYYDINNNLFFDKIKGDFILESNFPIVGKDTNYSVTIAPNTVIIKDDSRFDNIKPSLINSFLQVDYIYLDSIERFKFLKNSHSYLIPLVQNLPELTINSNNFNYKLNFKNPTKIIFWRTVLTSNINNNNQFEYTLLPLSNDSIIDQCKVILNSIDRVEIYDKEYYTNLQCYQNKLNNINIFMYSFSLYPKEYQPASSINFSKIDDASLQLRINKLIDYSNSAKIRSYSIYYNILNIIDGLGGLEYYV